jgi:ABC-2 type transport system ATP-binding protein
VVEIGEEATVLETASLRKEFPGLVAVESLDLKIGRGALYGLIGPNGSGKTTVIKLLVGLLRPTSGSAQILREKIPIRTNRPSLGYMPQEMAIYNDLTIHENLEFFGGLYSMSKVALKKREQELLCMVDLESRRDDLVAHLSGGMKHRISLACALIHDPSVLFLDEPTVGVDPELRVGFWQFFHKLKVEGRTVILTTHYMDEAVRCDIVGMMRNGRLIAEGSPAELMQRSGTKNLEDAFLSFSKGSR